MLIIGLGNPGAKYEKTYHNTGFMTVDRLAEKLDIKVDRKECSALTGSKFVGGERIVLCKPTTYMNNSGEAVASLIGRYKAEHSDVLVIYDDIDIPCGARRVRRSGSAGTHNGMRSIVALIGEDFMRMRVGMGKPAEIPLIDFVLMNLRKEDKPLIDKAIDKAVECLTEYIVDKDFDKLMRNYNGDPII